MGKVLLDALGKILAKNPALLEQLLEAGAQLLVQELQKKAQGAAS